MKTEELRRALRRAMRESGLMPFPETDEELPAEIVELLERLTRISEIFSGKPAGLVELRGDLENYSSPTGKDVKLTITVANSVENKVSLARIGRYVNIIGKEADLETAAEEASAQAHEEHPGQMMLQELSSAELRLEELLPRPEIADELRALSDTEEWWLDADLPGAALEESEGSVAEELTASQQGAWAGFSGYAQDANPFGVEEDASAGEAERAEALQVAWHEAYTEVQQLRLDGARTSWEEVGALTPTPLQEDEGEDTDAVDPPTPEAGYGEAGEAPEPEQKKKRGKKVA